MAIQARRMMTSNRQKEGKIDEYRGYVSGDEEIQEVQSIGFEGRDDSKITTFLFGVTRYIKW